MDEAICHVLPNTDRPDHTIYKQYRLNERYSTWNVPALPLKRYTEASCAHKYCSMLPLGTETKVFELACTGRRGY
jgi:hypothetical protein